MKINTAILAIKYHYGMHLWVPILGQTKWFTFIILSFKIHIMPILQVE